MSAQLTELLKHVDELKWHTLTATVNEIRGPAQFLKDLLFSRSQPVETEDIELGLREGAREVAPFVRKNGEALLVDGLQDKFQSVQAPNIRIKMPFTASNLLYTRRAGTPIFPGRGTQLSALQRKVADDLQFMADKITNAEELLCSQILAGQISYQVSPNENYQITVPRPASHVLVAPIFWDNADPQLPNPEQDAHTAKRVMSEDPGLSVTHCLLGEEAATHFINLCKRQNVLLDKRRLDDGSITLQTQFQESGAIFLGRAFGMDFWEYSRKLNVAGVSTDLIRPKYAEFIHVGPAADRVLYYGAIPDMTALQGGNYVGERFSKSWVQEDPSQIMYLTHSRPLPWARRPNTWVSMKVVSG